MVSIVRHSLNSVMAGLLLLCSLHTSQANAERRMAFVVGNSAYQHATVLPNAASDAEQFAKFLVGRGFDVDLLTDATRSSFADRLSAFAGRLRKGDLAVFYFAGHGMQLRGENFLLGLDARLENELDLQAEAVQLDAAMAMLERRAQIALIFIDACRNNPLAEKLNRKVEGITRGLRVQGLAPIETESAGTMVAFAASPGQVAYDGGEGVSPFTEALIKHLAEPGLEVGTAFKRVIRDVRNVTSGRQSPQIVSNLAIEIYLAPSEIETADDVLIVGAGSAEVEQEQTGRPAAPSDQTAKLAPVPIPQKSHQSGEEQARDFRKAERIATARGWELFLSKYSDGDLSEEARRRLAQFGGVDPAFLSPKEAEQRLFLTQSQRRELQLRLTDLGYDTGPADGAFGPQTRQAISRYQKAIGLTETGYVNRVLARRLELVGIPSASEVVSADEARPYVLGDIEGLETDPRILQAVKCTQGREIIYGEFQGHLYVAVYHRHSRWRDAEAAAARCSTHLATLNSKAENDFVYELFAIDDRMFNVGDDGFHHFKMGPWIGLVQEEGAREPKGGWRWINGEKLSFSNWWENVPNEHKEGDDFAMFYVGQDGRDVSDRDARTWDDMGPGNSTHGYVLEFD